MFANNKIKAVKINGDISTFFLQMNENVLILLRKQFRFIDFLLLQYDISNDLFVVVFKVVPIVFFT
jgi:hypothetical protein